MIQAAALAIVNSNDEILLMNRLYKPWGFGVPGGSRDDQDEDLVATAIRETNEEINYIFHREQLEYLDNIPSICGQFDVAVYRVRLETEKIPIQLNEEHDQPKWVSFNEAHRTFLAGNTFKIVMMALWTHK
jgi:8-oxo-dGTP pyrophosphatase MutT (NUDIX family)